jgi:hypothetical protein
LALSVILLALVYWYAYVVGGRSTAVWTCVLMALAVSQINYSVEVRPYMLSSVLVVGAMLAVYYMERGKGPMWFAALLVLLPLMLLTHYLTAGVVVAILVYGLLKPRAPGRFQLCMAAAFGMLMFGALWGRNLGSAAQIQVPFLMDPGSRWVDHLHRAASLPLVYLSHPRWPAVPSWYTWLGAVLLVAPIWAMRSRRELVLSYLVVVCTGLMLLVYDMRHATKLLAVVRYSIVAAPAVFILVTYCTPRWRWVVPAILAIVAVSSFRQVIYMRTEDYRAVARQIDDRGGAVPVAMLLTADGGFEAGLLHMGVQAYLKDESRMWYGGVAEGPGMTPLPSSPCGRWWIIAKKRFVPAGYVLEKSVPVVKVGVLELVKEGDKAVRQ